MPDTSETQRWEMFGIEACENFGLSRYRARLSHAMMSSAADGRDALGAPSTALGLLRRNLLQIILGDADRNGVYILVNPKTPSHLGRRGVKTRVSELGSHRAPDMASEGCAGSVRCFAPRG